MFWDREGEGLFRSPPTLDFHSSPSLLPPVAFFLLMVTPKNFPGVAPGGLQGGKAAGHFRSCRSGPLATPWPLLRHESHRWPAGVTQWSGQPTGQPVAAIHFPSSGGHGVGTLTRVGAGGPGKQPSLPPPPHKEGTRARLGMQPPDACTPGTPLKQTVASTPARTGRGEATVGPEYPSPSP